jgi:putative acetyltransferase
MHIRPIERTDNAALATVVRTVMTEHGASGAGFSIHDYEVDHMYEAYTEPRACYFVVIHAGRVVGGGGIAQLAGSDPSLCELRKMYFLPEGRGLGTGRTLLDFCLDAARRFGYTRCYLETLRSMHAAQRLYERVGFIRIPEPLGQTGHFSCDSFYVKDLGPSDG